MLSYNHSSNLNWYHLHIPPQLRLDYNFLIDLGMQFLNLNPMVYHYYTVDSHFTNSNDAKNRNYLLLYQLLSPLLLMKIYHLSLKLNANTKNLDDNKLYIVRKCFIEVLRNPIFSSWILFFPCRSIIKPSGIKLNVYIRFTISFLIWDKLLKLFFMLFYTNFSF